MVKRTISVTYNTLDFSRTKSEVQEDRRAIASGFVSGVVSYGVGAAVGETIPYLKGFSINDVSNIGKAMTLNFNTSAFEAITDNSIRLFQEGGH